MGTFNDFSELKKFKPAAPEPPKPAPKPLTQEERALAGAENSADYFSSLLGTGETRKPKPVAPAARGVPQPRTTVVTRDTVARVREEQVAARHEAIESELRDQLAVQEAANESLAEDLATVNRQLEDLRRELEEARRELEDSRRRQEDARNELTAANEKWTVENENREAAHAEALAALTARLEAKDGEYAKVCAALAEREEENARLRMQIENGKLKIENVSRGGSAGYGRDGVPSPSAFLRLPDGFSEKFDGEIREHVLETLSDAFAAAEAAGRDRRARILEEVLGVNTVSGELERRRAAVRRIVQEAGHKLDNTAIAALEKLGFKYVSGHSHHKLEWAGIRFPLAKTPSDYRSCLNSAAEISNRVF